MRKLMNKIDRFCYAHPRFGIPNLMLIIVIAFIIQRLEVINRLT